MKKALGLILILWGCATVPVVSSNTDQSPEIPARMPSAIVYAIPKDFRCNELVSNLTLIEKDGRWMARNNNTFRKNGAMLSFWVEVTITPTAHPDEFIVSAKDQGIEIRTFYSKNEGFSPFYNLKIKTSVDYVTAPGHATLPDGDGHLITDYTCCPAPMQAPERGHGSCQPPTKAISAPSAH
jgi:hypothetical protein